MLFFSCVVGSRGQILTQKRGFQKIYFLKHSEHLAFRELNRVCFYALSRHMLMQILVFLKNKFIVSALTARFWTPKDTQTGPQTTVCMNHWPFWRLVSFLISHFLTKILFWYFQLYKYLYDFRTFFVERSGRRGGGAKRWNSLCFAILVLFSVGRAAVSVLLESWIWKFEDYNIL